MNKEYFNISDYFFEAAAKFPDTTAIIDGKKSISFQQLKEDVLKTAARFKQKEIGRGDRVLIFVPMSIDLYRIVLALFHCGATAVFLDEWVNKQRMEECCRVAPCKGFIGVRKARILRWFSGELRKIPLSLKLKTPGSSPVFPPSKNTTSQDTALVTFTTGSTGTPKAAKRSHGFLDEQFKALREKINPQPGDVDMTLLPIVLLINLGTGVTSVIARFKASKPNGFRPALIAEQIRQQRVNRLTASPYFIRQLSAYLIQTKTRLPSVKQIFTGGAPVFRHEAAVYAKAFNDCDIQIVYGSTEAEPVSSVSAKDLLDISPAHSGLFVGKPYHKCEVKIIPISTEAITLKPGEDLLACPPGETGEIVVAGPHVLKEYLNNEEAFRKNKIVCGNTIYHRSGDSGYLDKNGRLFLCGRCTAAFTYQGQTIYPFLFEQGIQSIEGVSLGTALAHKTLLLAVVETQAPEMRKNIETEIYKMNPKPDKVVFTRSIPRDPRHHSKIDYLRLKEKLEGMRVGRL